MRKTGYLGFYRGYDIIRDRPDAIRILRDKVLIGSTTSMAAAINLIDLLATERCAAREGLFKRRG